MCWQQVKAAKTSLDALMALPVENSKDETRIDAPVLFGHYHFSEAMFRYYSDSTTITLRIKNLTMGAAHAPGTGTPVIGGLTTDKATKLVRGLQGLNIVGMDLVEVAPGYDHADLTSLAAATLALDMLHVQAANKG